MADVPLRHFILGTAGHVDHGKSALVRALTGIDPDRLPEEKLRGMTIDLGFAELRLASPSAPATLVIGMIDVPGHTDFAKNMVAGVSALDGAILVVAADDGWMPQTEEHLQILMYLGVSRVIVALSKIDCVEDSAKCIVAVQQQLIDTPFANAEIIPTSVVTGHGIAELKAAIGSMLSDLPDARDYGKPRLAVDRAFSLKGVGTVVTGTLIGGRISRGQSAIVQPGGLPVHIRAIQSHGNSLASAAPGSRVALNLPGAKVAARGEPEQGAVGRGDVIAMGDYRASRRVGVLLMPSARAIARTGDAAAGPRPLRQGARVRLHHGTAAVPARLRLLDDAAVAPDAPRAAILMTQRPLLTFAGDRFVLRDDSQQHTLGGGIILDPLARAAGAKNKNYLAAIRNLAGDPHNPMRHLLLQLARQPVFKREQALSQSNFSPREVDAVLAQASAGGSVVAVGEWLFDSSLWHALQADARGQITAHHAAHPQLTGMPLTELRTYVAGRLPGKVNKELAATVSAIVIAEISGDEYLSNNGVARHISHQPTLPPRLREAGADIRRRLAEQPFNPPSRGELCRGDIAMQGLRFLIATGTAIELSPEVVISAEAYVKAIAAIRSHLLSQGTATVSELKTILGSNRRVTVPLLEKLDREGITRRDGDKRRLPPEPRHGSPSI